MKICLNYNKLEGSQYLSVHCFLAYPAMLNKHFCNFGRISLWPDKNKKCFFLLIIHLFYLCNAHNEKLTSIILLYLKETNKK